MAPTTVVCSNKSNAGRRPTCTLRHISVTDASADRPTSKAIDLITWSACLHYQTVTPGILTCGFLFSILLLHHCGTDSLLGPAVLTGWKFG